MLLAQAMADDDLPHGGARSRLVPELLVGDLRRSLRFWCGLLGFQIVYARPEEGFVYLDRTGVQFMLGERGLAGRAWETGPLDPPLGRGVNFEIQIDAVAPILGRLTAVGWPLFMALEEKWYRVGLDEHGQRQFLVQDPDGYLLRLAEALGRRQIPG